MEDFWIVIGITAAFFQATRNGMMKHLKGSMADQTIILGRFVYSVPFAFLWLVAFVLFGFRLPDYNDQFMLYVLLASGVQLVGAYWFLKLLGRRNFVIGVTYSKIEALMAAIFGALLFAELVTKGAVFAILLGFAGIVIISIVEKHIEPKNLLTRIFTPSAALGFGCGTLFGLTGVFIRQAILALEGDIFFVKASYALFYILLTQALVMMVIMAVKDKKQIAEIITSYKKIYPVGLVNSLSSFGWFIAFSLTQAAYVSMVSQVEILFSIFMMHKVFGEKVSKLELLGIFMLVFSILMLVYYK